MNSNINGVRGISSEHESIRTIIVDVAPHALSREELEVRMTELESLVSTYG